MSDFLYQLHNALSDQQIHIIGNIDTATDRIQRFKRRDKSRGGYDVFVIIHGDRGATFGDWHDDRDKWITWWINGKPNISIDDRRERENERRLLDEIRYQKRQHAIKRAENFWLNTLAAQDIESHPYILQKHIRPYFSKRIIKRRWLHDILLVPIRDIDWQFQSIQIIRANGFKRAWKGTTYKDNMIWLSYQLPDDYSGVIRICEGYATGCTIYQVTKSPVVCALSAHNLPNVAQLLRKKYPNANLKICADNDQWGKENTGLKCAIEADIVANAVIYWPEFDGLSVNSKPTDYNDLYVLGGYEIVRKQLILIRK